MTLARIALALAVIPGLLLLYIAAMGARTQAQFDASILRAQLEDVSISEMSNQDMARLARRHNLWALELRDRSGTPLAFWQRYPGARQGLIGAPLEFTHPPSGALFRSWSAPAEYLSLALAGAAIVWILLMLTAVMQLRRPAPQLPVRMVSAAHHEAEPNLRPKLRSALDGLPIALAIADAQGIIRYTNTRMCDWLGRSRSQLRGCKLEEMIRLYGPGVETPVVPWRDASGSEPAGTWVLKAQGQERSVSVSWSEGYDQSLLLGLVDSSSIEAGQKETRERVHLLHHILDVLPLGVLVTDSEGRIQIANRNAERQFAWAPGEMEGEEVTRLMPVPFLNQPEVCLENYRGQGAHRNTELPKVVGWRKDATTFPVGLTVEDLPDESGGFLVLIEDLTEAMHTAAAQSRLGRLFEQTAEEVLILDARSLYVREANRGAQENLGFSLQQLRRMTLFHLAPGLDAAKTEPQLASLRGGEQRELRLSTAFSRADDSSYPVRLSLTCSREEEPPVLMLLAHDVTAQRAAESRLAWMSGHDTLTRLPNRSAAMEELARGDTNADSNTWIGLLRVDNLDELNIRYGHDQGDEVIATLAERLQQQLPDAPLIARWSGASFVLVLPSPLPDLGSLCARLAEAIELAVVSVPLQLSLGLARMQRRAELSLTAATEALNQAQKSESTYWINESSSSA